MQHQGAQAYANTAKLAVSPRDREADLLVKAAHKLQTVRDDWDNRHKTELEGALNFNRKLWVIFLQSVTREENPLPDHIKQNVANLGIYIMNVTLELTSKPVPEKLTSLITINRELAAGLRQKPQTENAEAELDAAPPSGSAA